MHSRRRAGNIRVTSMAPELPKIELMPGSELRRPRGGRRLARLDCELVISATGVDLSLLPPPKREVFTADNDADRKRKAEHKVRQYMGKYDIPADRLRVTLVSEVGMRPMREKLHKAY